MWWQTGMKGRQPFNDLACYKSDEYTARLLWLAMWYLLHSYCTGTCTEVTVLLLWGNSAVTMEYPHSFSVGVPAWVLQGSIGATSKKQHCYFSAGTSAVTV